MTLSSVWLASQVTHARLAAVQLLSLPERTHLLEDLHILASTLPDEDGGYFPALKEHYTQARFSCPFLLFQHTWQ